MIILDTNVVFEPLKPHGAAAVRNWLDKQVTETLYLTATSLTELLLGAELLPDGERKQLLAVTLTDQIGKLFGSRILPFDYKAALVFCAGIHRARSHGQAISVADAQIAAIATLHGFTVATRDIAPFIAAGVPVVNPWETTAQ